MQLENNIVLRAKKGRTTVFLCILLRRFMFHKDESKIPLRRFFVVRYVTYFSRGLIFAGKEPCEFKRKLFSIRLSQHTVFAMLCFSVNSFLSVPVERLGSGVNSVDHDRTSLDP